MADDCRVRKLLYNLSNAKNYLRESSYWIDQIYRNDKNLFPHAKEASGAADLIEKWITEIKK